VTVVLNRIDDRLIHGQVVVGWGQPLDIDFFVLVNDEVAASEWEQELYRMGVPPEMVVYFLTIEDAVRQLPDLRADRRRGILLTSDVQTMCQLVERAGIGSVNVGGLHYRADRAQRLRYIFLSPEETRALRELVRRGVAVSAQDVPGARPVPLNELLAEVAS
jgi:PTS system mannose-specific IIB component/fructoselysine and glucoselysine-specific PTS system IIB component